MGNCCKKQLHPIEEITYVNAENDMFEEFIYTLNNHVFDQSDSSTTYNQNNKITNSLQVKQNNTNRNS